MQEIRTPAKHIRVNVLGMSQKELAERCGVTQATVSRWDTGAVPILPAAAQRKIREMAQRRGTWDDKWFFEIPERAA